MKRSSSTGVPEPRPVGRNRFSSSITVGSLRWSCIGLGSFA
ncbi:Uncharacterised protein [Amycolatopsis camponoti]|uniref:Uncharacterized protein n=1 Tax=Amycolatopsis camponoti TaxID=2606593 RepID=A0A6I8LGF0_9PSEU|nr:Uncharacterised protein [Amycolatopsis camponoti]